MHEQSEPRSTLFTIGCSKSLCQPQGTLTTHTYGRLIEKPSVVRAARVEKCGQKNDKGELGEVRPFNIHVHKVRYSMGNDRVMTSRPKSHVTFSSFAVIGNEY
mgnify:CR=1 FL=1